MSNFQIVSDSSCDLPKIILEQNNIHVVPFYVSFDGENYLKENVDIEIGEFYNRLNRKEYSKTSLPSVHDYTEAFTSYLENGIDVMCFCLTSKFSGSYQSAVNAASIVKETYPDRKIEVIDSFQATCGQGALLLEGAKMRDKNYDFDKTVEIIDKIKNDSLIAFTVNTLEYLQKGGRIGKASALAGSLLNIKPVIVFTDGELVPNKKVRGRKKAIHEVVAKCNEFLGDKHEDYVITVLHSESLEEADDLKKQLTNEYGYKIDLPLCILGVTIGTHIGPSVVGVSMLKRHDAV